MIIGIFYLLNYLYKFANFSITKRDNYKALFKITFIFYYSLRENKENKCDYSRRE